MTMIQANGGFANAAPATGAAQQDAADFGQAFGAAEGGKNNSAEGGSNNAAEQLNALSQLITQLFQMLMMMMFLGTGMGGAGGKSSGNNDDAGADQGEDAAADQGDDAAADQGDDANFTDGAHVCEGGDPKPPAANQGIELNDLSPIEPIVVDGGAPNNAGPNTPAPNNPAPNNPAPNNPAPNNPAPNQPAAEQPEQPAQPEEPEVAVDPAPNNPAPNNPAPNNPAPNAAAPEVPAAAELPEADIQGNWIAKHGQYTRNADGTIDLTGGQYAGHKLVPHEDGGKKYYVCNAGGEKVATYEAPRTEANGDNKVASPIAFDMNNDGKIGTTGETTAKDGVRSSIGETVEFDIDADGTKDRIEWMSGDGDALLVDNRDGNAANDMDGARLFGDQGGKYTDGYQKLSQLDLNGDQVLTAGELQGLMLWQDDGDAVVEDGEMVSAADAGVTSISVVRNDVANDRGETLMRSAAEVNGETMMTEDVWFGQD